MYTHITRLPIPYKARSNHHDLHQTAHCDRCTKVTHSSSKWQCCFAGRA